MKMRYTADNLSSCLLAILLVAESYTLLQQIPVVLAEGRAASSLLPSTTTTCDESLTAPIARPCPDPDLLKMSYVSRGSVDCGGALRLEQAAISPSIKADPSIVDPGGLYSLVLVDTTTTTAVTEGFFSPESAHPILHYGAVNIQGSTLLQGLSLDRTDRLDVFSSYRGPNPPQPNSEGATPGIENALFAYEYMLAAQPQNDAPIEVPELADGSVVRFDYEAFFEETVGVGFNNLTSSTYFVSGWCVKEITVSGRQDPTEAPTVSSPTVPQMMTSAVEAQSNSENDESSSSSETNNEQSSKATMDTSSSGAGMISVDTIWKIGIAALGIIFTTWLSNHY